MRPDWFDEAVSAAMIKHEKTPSNVAIREVLTEVPDELKADGEVDSVVISYHLKSYRKEHKPKAFKTLVQEFMNSISNENFQSLSEESKDKAQQILVRLDDGNS